LGSVDSSRVEIFWNEGDTENREILGSVDSRRVGMGDVEKWLDLMRLCEDFGGQSGPGGESWP
jgi:hypothetical protein